MVDWREVWLWNWNWSKVGLIWKPDSSSDENMFGLMFLLGQEDEKSGSTEWNNTLFWVKNKPKMQAVFTGENQDYHALRPHEIVINLSCHLLLCSHHILYNDK